MKELAVVTGFIMYYELLEEYINGSFFTQIDKAIEIAQAFIEIYPEDYEWVDEDFEETLGVFCKNYIKKEKYNK